MRKESSNQFTEGVISDLNPINTPNTVLTDALNATIITYDGNEHSLQNDRGNYPLKNCKLKPNYIPVGIKEYNGILYIVSYNPLDQHVEIGSYPSPMQATPENDPGDNERTINSIIKTGIIDNGLTEKNYSDLSELEKQIEKRRKYEEIIKKLKAEKKEIEKMFLLLENSISFGKVLQ